MTDYRNVRKKTAVIKKLSVWMGIWMIALFFLTNPFSGCKEVQAAQTDLENMRGVWIAYVDYANLGLYNKSEATFTRNADKIFKQLKKDKINTVFFHVVPYDDAIYPSEYLGWSKKMFKKEPAYDPLEILIETSHKYGISFHAWINPYRKSSGKSYNPGKAASTKRIVNIVEEIVTNYDVDGIHFDDYFYPENGQFKKVSVSKRKKNVNKMVKTVYQTVKQINPDVVFGISPAGNLQYARSIGCDLETWLSQSGYVDYIVPQIYWTDDYKLNGKKYKMYTNRLNEWIAINQNETPMMIGLALYQSGTRSRVDKGWSKRSNNIVKQIKQQKKAGCQGFVLFSGTYMTNRSARKEMKNYRKYIKTE